MTTSFDYDLLVIGAGSGGVRAARVAASLGANVAIIESDKLGGTCVNVGCIPKKLFFYASHYMEDLHNAADFGWDIPTPCFNWQQLLENKDKEILRLNGVYKNLLTKVGVNILYGHGEVINDHQVRVDQQTYSSRYILIATGGTPKVPDLIGKEHLITSNEVFYLPNLPQQIIIVGGGYIAVEFAGVFHGLGVDTTLIYRGEQLLKAFDADLGHHLQVAMSQKGINIISPNNIRHIKQQGKQLVATLDDDQQLHAETILYATGRQPNTTQLGLENVSVAQDQAQAIVVDEQFQTSVASIYAVGDVTNRVNLTPVALAEGVKLAHHLFGDQQHNVDYDCIPTCVFSQPNISSVGLTEKQAKEIYTNIKIYTKHFKPMKSSLGQSTEKIFMKMIVNQENDRVVGIHIMGAEAGEIMQGMAIAIRAGATKAMFDSTIGIHPTIAEELVSMRT